MLENFKIFNEANNFEFDYTLKNNHWVAEPYEGDRIIFEASNTAFIETSFVKICLELKEKSILVKSILGDWNSISQSSYLSLCETIKEDYENEDLDLKQFVYCVEKLYKELVEYAN